MAAKSFRGTVTLPRAAITFAAAVGVAAGGGGGAAADTVIDGDTFELEGQVIRLHGIDAFELQQTCLDAAGEPWRCGVAAKAALAERVNGTTLSCTVLDEQRSGEYVARCETPNGDDLGAYMVENGLALANRRLSDEYVDEEQTARAAGAGAWTGTFMAPWTWRQEES